MRASYVLDNLLAAPYKLWFFFLLNERLLLFIIIMMTDCIQLYICSGLQNVNCATHFLIRNHLHLKYLHLHQEESCLLLKKKKKMKLCPALQESNISLITQYCIVYPILHIKIMHKNHIYMMKQALNHIWTKDITIRRPSGLIISALDSALRSLSRKPGCQSLCCILGWDTLSHSTSLTHLYPEVQMGGEGRGGRVLNLQWTNISSNGE